MGLGVAKTYENDTYVHRFIFHIDYYHYSVYQISNHIFPFAYCIIAWCDSWKDGGQNACCDSWMHQKWRPIGIRVVGDSRTSGGGGPGGGACGGYVGGRPRSRLGRPGFAEGRLVGVAVRWWVRWERTPQPRDIYI